MRRREIQVVLAAAALLTLMTPAADAQAPPPHAVTPPQPRGFALIPGIDIPLTRDLAAGDATQGASVSGSPRLQLTARYSPRETWFGRVTAYYYFESSRKAPWNPDFTYSFGYDSWRPGTFALTYDNYNGNRVNPDAGGHVTRFEEGSITARYKLPMPRALESRFASDGEDHLSGAIGVHLTPRFQRLGATDRGEWKRSLSAGARVRFYRRLYVEGQAFYYPSGDQQQPWDPDFTYGFGWFDWHPGTVSVQYGNYAGNRFFGHSRPGGASLRDGSLTVTYIGAW